MQPTRLPRKKDVVLQLLEQATVYVHLDPRPEAVRVPPWFKRQPQLVLQIGLNMAVPIPDLQVDDEGISCTLSFNRSPFLCVIPWASVFALVDENRQGMVWPDDVPPELAAQAAQAKQAQARPDLKVAPAPAATKPEAPAKAAAVKAGTPSAKAKRARKAATKPARPRAEPAAKREAATKPRAAAVTKARVAATAAKPRAAAKRAPAAALQKAPVAQKVLAAQKAPAAQKPPVAQKAPVQRAEPAIAPAPAAAAGGGSKRKLPPYLRVVK
jgi:stringent starvation protein B